MTLHSSIKNGPCPCSQTFVLMASSQFLVPPTPTHDVDDHDDHDDDVDKLHTVLDQVRDDVTTSSRKHPGPGSKEGVKKLTILLCRLRPARHKTVSIMKKVLKRA